MSSSVSGPGEMVDADFGYVGSGPGTVHLYVGRERVAARVPESEAPRRLEELILERTPPTASESDESADSRGGSHSGGAAPSVPAMSLAAGAAAPAR